MKESKFNIEISIDDDCNILYNTFTSGVLKLNKEYKNKYDKLKDSNYEKGLYDDVRNELIKGGMIVEHNFDEITAIRIAHLSSRFNDKEIGFTIVPTMECNFECVYCFEEGVRYNTMSTEVLDKTIKYINNAIKDANSFQIAWYGGEPTLALNEIEYIYEGIKHNIENGKQFGSSIITNGLLMNKNTVERLKSVGVNMAQITLDGSRNSHDKRRYLKNKGPTYDKILNNLRDIAGMINISIRVNVDKRNQNEIYEILDDLGEETLNKVSIYVAPVTETEERKIKGSICIGNKEFSKIDMDFISHVQNKYIKTISMPQINISGCTANSINSVIIDPLGDLYKCWNYVGRSDYKVGNLDTGIIPNSLIDSYLLNDNIEKECMDCKILPLCYGGCPDNKRIKMSLEERCIVDKYNIEQKLKKFVCDKLELSYNVSDD